MKKRIISALLALLFAVSLIPVIGATVRAAGDLTVNVTFDPSTATADVTWDNVPGASKYSLALMSYDPYYDRYLQVNGFITTGVVGTSYTIDAPAFKLTSPSDDYRVSVWAVDEEESSLAEGESQTFHTGRTTLSTPVVTLSESGLASWSNVDGATEYHLSLYPDTFGGVNRIAKADVTAPQTTYDFSSHFLPGNQYHVYIYATSSNPLVRDSERAASSGVNVPGEKAFMTGLSMNGTVFSWDPFPGASEYYLWLMKSDGTTYYQCGQGRSYGTEYDFGEYLTEHGTGRYYVAIVAQKESYNDISNRTESPLFEYEYRPILSGTVSIRGGAKHYGDLLELEYKGDIAGIPASSLRFEWLESTNKATWTNLIGESGPSFQTPAAGDAVTYIRVRVTADGYDGAVYSDARAVAPAPVTDTLKGTVTAVQDHPSEAFYTIGTPITATAKNPSDIEMTMDGLTYRWQRRKDADSQWEYIPGAAGKTYTPSNADEQCWIRAEVSYSQTLGELYSRSKWVSWREDTHMVFFDMQGHGSPVSAQEISRGACAGEPSPKPSAEGWTFGGWYTEAACIVPYKFDTPVTEDITLYADWRDDSARFVLTGVSISADVSRNAGHYILDDETAEFTWKDGKAPGASAMESSGSRLCTDAACTDQITEEPVPGGVYYVQYEIYNNTRNDLSIGFSDLTAANASLNAPGYTAVCSDVDADVDSMGFSRVRILFRLTRSSDLAFTVQPADGTANKSEDYSYSWALNDTPDSLVIQAWFDGSWHDGSSLMGKTSDTVSYSEGVSRYRIRAEKAGQAIYSDEFTVTWTEGEAAEQPNPFTDVSKSDLCYDAVLWAYYHDPQITDGMTDTTFGPEMTVTRGQCVAFLWRAMGKPEPAITENPFTDVPVSQYYYKPVLWAVEKGITDGVTDTTFAPDATLTTQHIVTFLYRTLNPGEDGWNGEAAAWAGKDDGGKPFGVDIAVNNKTDCPRWCVVQFLYKTVK